LATVINILVVEQPAAVRRTLCARLAVEADMAVVGEAEDGASAVSLALARPPHVILLDAEMPHLALVDAVRTLRAEAPRAALVVLTLHTAAVAQALGGGAIVVGKHEGTTTLVAAIRRAAAGGQPD
jgi:DNA-binding NarL/FixJ family response regulator